MFIHRVRPAYASACSGRVNFVTPFVRNAYTPAGKTVPEWDTVFPFLNPFWENVMTSLHLMSREELARELVAAPKTRRNTATTDATSTPNCLRTPAYDQKVRRKLDLAREILLRDLTEPLKRTWSLTSPKTVREWLTIRYCGVEREIFLALYLDVKMRLIDTEDLSAGTLTTTSVYPRELVKSALRHNACFILFAHNHPSGCPDPSDADVNLTRTLRKAMALIDIEVLDHVIVGSGDFFSFAEKGLL